MGYRKGVLVPDVEQVRVRLLCAAVLRDPRLNSAAGELRESLDNACYFKSVIRYAPFYKSFWVFSGYRIYR